MSDIVERYERITGQFSDRVRAVSADAWNNPSPCEGWTARDVVGHLTEWIPAFFGSQGVEFPTVPSVQDDPVGAWETVQSTIAKALADPTMAAKQIETPFSTQSLAETVDLIVTGDVFTHTWDLARATGQSETLDPDQLQRMIAALAATPEGVLRADGMFGPPVEELRCSADGSPPGCPPVRVWLANGQLPSGTAFAGSGSRGGCQARSFAALPAAARGDDNEEGPVAVAPSNGGGRRLQRCRRVTGAAAGGRGRAGARRSVGWVPIINNGFDLDRTCNTWGMPARGEVWWVCGAEPLPVVVLSCRHEPEVRAIYVVPAAETDISGVAIELRVGREEGLPSGVVRVALARQNRINCAWLVSLKESDLNEQAGTLSEEKLSILAEMLRLGGLE